MPAMSTHPATAPAVSEETAPGVVTTLTLISTHLTAPTGGLGDAILTVDAVAFDDGEALPRVALDSLEVSAQGALVAQLAVDNSHVEIDGNGRVSTVHGCPVVTPPAEEAPYVVHDDLALVTIYVSSLATRSPRIRERSRLAFQAELGGYQWWRGDSPWQRGELDQVGVDEAGQ